MAAAVVTRRAVCQSRRPQINLDDVPELMPGAQPSANPAARSEFEERCRHLYESATEERDTYSELAWPVSTKWIDDLEVMFPTVDPELVRLLAADASTQQHAINTLLAISAPAPEPNQPVAAKTPSPGDALAFPVLVSADGWQVVSKRHLDQARDDLGSAWCDLAKAAVDKPAPQAIVAPRTSKLKKRTGDEESNSFDETPQDTEYEIRQRLGQQRVRNRAKFDRRAPVLIPDTSQAQADVDDSDVAHDVLALSVD